MITGIILVGLVVLFVGYVCLCVKIGFIVAEVTENTGFDVGFYMMTVFGLLALPVAIVVGVCS